jgi:hypothetical protein
MYMVSHGIVDFYSAGVVTRGRRTGLNMYNFVTSMQTYTFKFSFDRNLIFIYVHELKTKETTQKATI